MLHKRANCRNWWARWMSCDVELFRNYSATLTWRPLLKRKELKRGEISVLCFKMATRMPSSLTSADSLHRFRFALLVNIIGWAPFYLLCVIHNLSQTISDSFLVPLAQNVAYIIRDILTYYVRASVWNIRITCQICSLWYTKFFILAVLGNQSRYDFIQPYLN